MTLTLEPLVLVMVAADAHTAGQFTAAVTPRQHRIENFGDFDRAWKWCGENAFDIVLPDVDENEDAAVALCHRVRLLVRPKRPLLMPWVSEARIPVALAAGADDYLLRPLTLATLEARLIVAERRIRVRRAGEQPSHLLAQIMTSLAEVQDFDVALRLMLREVCEATGWPCGQAWLPTEAPTDATQPMVDQRNSTTRPSDDAGDSGARPVLHLCDGWYAPDRSVERIRDVSQRIEFRSGEGLPGRAYAQPQTAQVMRMDEESGFGRSEAALSCGLRHGFAVPVIARNRVLAVLEFMFADHDADHAAYERTVISAALHVGSVLDRIRAEAEQHRSEARFWSVTQSSSDAIITADSRGRVLSWNEGAERMFGYSARVMSGRPMAAILPERFREVQQEGFARFLRSHNRTYSGGTVELVGLHSDGHEFPIEMSNSAWRDGAETFFGQIIRDATPRRKATAELTAHSRRVAATADIARRAMTTDVRDLLPLSLRLVAEALQVDAGALWSCDEDRLRVLKLWPQPVSEDVREKVNTIDMHAPTWLERLVGAENPYACAPRFAAEGACGLPVADAIAVRVDEAQPPAILCVGRVTSVEFTANEAEFLKSVGHILANAIRRERIESALARSEQHFRSVVEASRDIVTVLDADGRILYESPAIRRILGYESDELIGTLSFDHVHPDHLERIRRTFSHAARTGEAQLVEHLHRHKDGTWRWLESQGAFTGSRYGDTTAIVTSRDVTERHLAEAAAARFQEQQRQTQKMEALGRLAAGVAHDFNNLLHAIHGWAELIAARKDDATSVEEYARNVLDTSGRARELISQLLLFSRSKTPRVEVIDPSELIRRTEGILQRLCGNKIRLSLEMTEGLTVMADPSQLEQVLVNLVVNAADAMPKSGALTLSTSFAEKSGDEECAVPSGRWCCLAVRDQGSGIAEDALAHIFEPFYTTKGEGRGTGLGLSTVYAIVSQANGYVTVVSRPGIGTTFRVYLPLC